MNRLLFIGVLGVVLGMALSPCPAQSGEEEELYEEGKKEFRSCAACHCTNEPTMKEDEDWLKLNRVTRCIDAGDETPRVRKALDAFFRSAKTNRPLFVDESFRPNEGRACGKIRVPATSGSVYLKAEWESVRKGAPLKVRLYWKKSDKGKTLLVPAGKYRVIVYRFYRRDEKGLWTLSVTDVNGCADLSVTEDRVETFGFKPEMQGALFAEEFEDELELSLALRNETDSTLTLSLNGDMNLPQFQVVDAEGKELFRDAYENT